MLKHSFLILTCLFLAITVQANHVVGGFISYVALGDDHYQVDLHVYTDCFGSTSALESTNVFFLADECLAFSGAFELIEQVEISDLCEDLIDLSSCNEGLAPGIWALHYQLDDVVLDPNCDWEIRWQSEDWHVFENALNPDFATAVITTEFIEPNISTPEIPVHVVSLMAPEQEMWSNMFALAPDDHSTSGLMVPLKTLESNELVDHTVDPPITTADWNEENAYLLGSAPAVGGYYGFGVEFESWSDEGILANRIHYASTIIVADPSWYGVVEETPYFESPMIINVENGELTGSSSLEVVAGEELCFDVLADITGGGFAVIYTTIFDHFPNADVTWTGFEGSTIEFFCIETTAADIGEYEFHVIAEGLFCGNFQEIESITIDVVAPDPCLDSQPITQESVTIESVLQLLSEWGGTGSACGGDLDGDNVVTMLDLLVLLSWLGG